MYNQPNQSFYECAEAEIKRRREVNTEKLNLRKREIEKIIPEYKAIRLELMKTGERLYRIIMSAEDAAKKLARLERENITAQEAIKVLLVGNKYAPDYLDEIYTCQKCRDTGVYQNRRCYCFKEIVKRLAADELNASAPIKLSSFETFDINLYPDRTDTDTGINIKNKMMRNFKTCKDFADNFHLPCTGILMFGKTGLGKTHLSLAVAKTVILKNHSVIYGSAPDLLRKIEKEHFSRTAGDDRSDTAGLLQEADLLIFDDLGAEFESRFYVSAFYNLLNSRINAGLPLIINTNLTEKELKERYGDRIMSRLLTMECLKFIGDDIRVGKKYGISV
ncbi:MAG: ATP-binding protein [Oscillospiraceae bacterium]|nr:ATP-binding protein [Oscillospiraceae bacterium]